MSQIKPMTEVRQKQKREKLPTYLTYIRMCDCLACGKSAPSEAAHIRYPDLRYGKMMTGMQEKPHDKWTVPLCAWCHREGPNAQHKMNERKFWKERNIDPVETAARLYEASRRNEISDVPAMRAIVNEISVFARIG